MDSKRSPRPKVKGIPELTISYIATGDPRNGYARDMSNGVWWEMATVLLIDESLEGGSAISEILDKAGHNVVLTIEPARALELCADINFDVIMCDLCLREKPHKKAGSLLVGMDTLWKFVDYHPKLPIIAMSRHLDQSTLEAIKKLGICGALSHPLDEVEVLETVHKAVTKYVPSERVAM